MKKFILMNAKYIFSICIYLLISSCSENIDKIPQTKKEPEKLNDMLVVRGQFIYSKQCIKCHEMEINLKGPALRNVTKRRKADWIKSMILKPDKMIVEDSIAKKLYYEHGVKMAVEDLTDDDANAVMEYLKSVDAKVENKTN